MRARPLCGAEVEEREAVRVLDTQKLEFTSGGEVSTLAFDYAADGNLSQLHFFRGEHRPMVEAPFWVTLTFSAKRELPSCWKKLLQPQSSVAPDVV